MDRGQRKREEKREREKGEEKCSGCILDFSIELIGTAATRAERKWPSSSSTTNATGLRVYLGLLLWEELARGRNEITRRMRRRSGNKLDRAGIRWRIER